MPVVHHWFHGDDTNGGPWWRLSFWVLRSCVILRSLTLTILAIVDCFFEVSMTFNDLSVPCRGFAIIEILRISYRNSVDLHTWKLGISAIFDKDKKSNFPSEHRHGIDHEALEYFSNRKQHIYRVDSMDSMCWTKNIPAVGRLFTPGSCSPKRWMKHHGITFEMSHRASESSKRQPGQSWIIYHLWAVRVDKTNSQMIMELKMVDGWWFPEEPTIVFTDQGWFPEFPLS